MVNNLPASARDTEDTGSIPGLGRSLEKEMAPTLVFLPRKSHGQRSLVGYTVHGVTKSWTGLSEHAHMQILCLKMEGKISSK